MLLKIIPLVFVFARLCDAIVYDCFTGNQATTEQMGKYKKIGATSTCTMDIRACNATERRRVDGSCNSLNNPMKGTYFVPLRRMLKANYFNGSHATKSIDGSDLKNPRYIRNLLLCVGQSTSVEFTQAVPGYAVFCFVDIGSIHDIKYFLQNKTDCCTAEGMKSPQCTSNIINEDDPVHRYSDIRCMNLTKPLTYSDYGCTDDTEPSPIEEATAIFDLSHIYNFANKGDSAIRSYEGGKMKVDIDSDGIIWPPNGDGFCPANQPGETRCFGNYPNTLLSVVLFVIWYLRQHNYFATELAKVNPSWDDETLFQTARDINIAFHLQVYHYEWLATLIGKRRLIAEGILSNCSKHRDIYDNSTYPQVSLEFAFTHRWFHTMQEGSAHSYDDNGTYLGEYPFVNFTMRPGFLGINKNIVRFTKQTYLQSCGKVGPRVHPDLAENGLPYTQHAVDIVTSDLHKTRLFGFAPYIDYLYNCTGHNVTSFEDLELHIDEESVKQLRKSYNHVEDIELMAGLWTEKPIDGGSIPATLACIFIDHIKKAIKSDRHWYERADRPYAFTQDQLWEIRKATVARLLCNAADNVTEIQANAFLVVDPDDNPLVSCSEIPNIDFTKWAVSNSSCDNSTTTDNTTSSTDASSSSSSSSNTTSDDASSNSDAASSSSSSSATTANESSSSGDTSNSTNITSAESPSSADASSSSDTTSDGSSSSSDASSSSDTTSDQSSSSSDGSGSTSTSTNTTSASSSTSSYTYNSTSTSSKSSSSSSTSLNNTSS